MAEFFIVPLSQICKAGGEYRLSEMMQDLRFVVLQCSVHCDKTLGCDMCMFSEYIFGMPTLWKPGDVSVTWRNLEGL